VSKFLQEPKLASKGQLHKGRTKDFTVGGGYYLSFCGLFDIGPAGGWSYQYQELTVRHARCQGSLDLSLDGLQFSNRWQGPWAGVDAKLHFCGFELRGGYEYHWAKWRGHWFLKDPEICDVSFSESCESTHVNGQAVYLDAVWQLLPFVELGLGLKWQRYQAKNGKEKSKSQSFEHAFTGWRAGDKVKHATWESYAISLLLGVSF
jgi:hypothetical protein